MEDFQVYFDHAISQPQQFYSRTRKITTLLQEQQIEAADLFIRRKYHTNIFHWLNYYDEYIAFTIPI